MKCTCLFIAHRLLGTIYRLMLSSYTVVRYVAQQKVLKPAISAQVFKVGCMYWGVQHLRISILK